MARPKSTLSIKSEKINRQSSIDNMILNELLPDPDRVLEKLGIDADQAFQDIMADDHLTAVMGTRQASVKGMTWDVTLGESDDRILKAVDNMLKGINKNHNGMGIYRMIDDILQANPWGMSCCEVIWKTGVNEWLPVAVKGKPFRYFTFNNKNELKFLSSGNSFDGEKIPPKKILLARHWITSNSFENPYGDKLLSKSYWPVTFKRNGTQWWNVFVEKYAMPLLIGKVKPSVSETDREKLAEDLAEAVQDAVLLTSQDHEIEFQEPKSNRSSEIYEGLNHYMNSAISKIWLGQTLTTEMGDVGSYAASKTHQGVKDERRNQDKKMVESTFQTLIDWFVELNFGEAESPVFSLIEPLGVNQELAERTKILSEAGVKHLAPFYMRNFGLEEDEFEIEEKPMEGEFSKFQVKDQVAVDKMLDSITPEELQKQAEGFLKPVIKLVNESNSYDEVLEKLLDVYPQMKTASLEDMLTRAVFISESMGRFNHE